MNVPFILGFLLCSHGDSNLGRELNRRFHSALQVVFDVFHDTVLYLFRAAIYKSLVITVSVLSVLPSVLVMRRVVILVVRPIFLSQFNKDSCFDSVPVPLDSISIYMGACLGDMSLFM